jgi:dimeric dUTPase (all-alpha-NTP-PPase superfamily)
MITSSIIHESVELQRETNFKHWKQEKEIDVDKIKSECIDLWHFLIQLSLEVGLTPDDLYKEYLKKNKENRDRQDNGY